MGKRLAAKKWREMTLEEMDKWWSDLTKGLTLTTTKNRIIST